MIKVKQSTKIIGAKSVYTTEILNYLSKLLPPAPSSRAPVWGEEGDKVLGQLEDVFKQNCCPGIRLHVEIKDNQFLNLGLEYG